MDPYRYILPTYRNVIAGRIFEPFRLPYVRAYLRVGEACLGTSGISVAGNE